jgi:chromate transporter
MVKQRRRLYLQLFLTTLKISAFTIGGGYVIVPLLQKRVVEELGWIDETEMLDIVAVSQSSPGPIAVNASLMVGYRVAGIPGALITMFGTILPPLVTISVISLFYQQFRSNAYVNAAMLGMQAGVAAVVAGVVIDMATNMAKKMRLFGVLAMLFSFALVFFLKVNAVWIILGFSLLGLVTGLIRTKRQNGASSSPDTDGQGQPDCPEEEYAVPYAPDAGEEMPQDSKVMR